MILLASLILILLTVPFLLLKLIIYFRKTIWKKNHYNTFSVGFFHPFCNAGGGGERVLWVSVRAIQKEYKDIHCVIYSGDNIDSEDILKNVEERFNIKINKKVEIVHLRSRNFVEAKYYPYFTLLMQSLGSVILGFEALFKHVPDVYLDTMGYAFTLPIFKFLGSCKVATYVHFPTISTDMLQVVESRAVAVNNQRFISNSSLLSKLKLIYYKWFAFLYGTVGSLSEVIMVNSTWTKNHILELWRKPESTFTIYPPCNVSEFSAIPLRQDESNKFQIISIAQFRPEKNHQLQIKSFHEFMNRLGQVPKTPTLVLIGSCRHKEDNERVVELKKLCKNLNLTENVEFKVNLTFKDIIQEMKNSSVALHTMINEHFGISLVECMAAGLILIAHNSGGPKLDIVIDEDDDKRTGFLATDVDTFASALEKIYEMDNQEILKTRINARESVARFSDEKFEETFLAVIKILFV